MAELNFGILNPNTPADVANSYYSGQQELMKNALLQSQLQQAQGANALQQYQLSQARRQDTLQDQMLNELRAANGDPEAIKNALIRAGKPDQAFKLQTDQANLAKTQAETGQIKSKALAGAAAPMYLNPTDDNIKNGLASYTAATGEPTDKTAAHLLSIPDLETRKQAILSLVMQHPEGRQALEAILPKAEKIDTGGSVGFVNTNPLAGQVGQQIAGSPVVKKTMTPGEIASNAIAQQNLNIRKVEADPLGMLGLNKGGMAAGGGSATPTAAQPQVISGDQLLQSIPKPIADQVKALAEGRMAFPQGFALKSPYWQNMISLVSQYDPNFDAVNYNARAKTRADFTSGQSSKNLTAINTAIGHLQTLSTAADALNNTSLTPVNSVVNYAKQITGNPNITSFDVAKNAVGDELMRVFRGSGASEHEAQAWKNTISSAASPEQLKAAVSQAGDLLESRITALNDTYNRGMGTTSDVLQMVSPKSRAALNKMRGISTNNASQQPQGALPSGWTVEVH